MGIGISIFLVALGAILRYAVTVQADGLDLHTIGNILMVVGITGGLLSLAFWASWGSGGITRGDSRTIIEEDGPRVTRRTRVEKRETDL